MKHIPVTKQELIEHIELMRDYLSIHIEVDAEVMQNTNNLLERLEVDLDDEEN